jgi:hypothetical protein
MPKIIFQGIKQQKNNLFYEKYFSVENIFQQKYFTPKEIKA